MDDHERPIRVVLVDDHALLREGLREIIDAQDDLTVVGEAKTAASAVATVGATRPDIVLLDVEIPGGEAPTTVARIKELCPETHVIILSMYDGPQLLQRLLSAGIRGYLLKSIHRHELVSAIRSVYHDPDRLVLSVSVESLASVGNSASEVLTDRETEILQLAAQALSNNQIGSRLGLTEATVKRHLRNIFIKLGAVSRIDAVNKAVAASLITGTR